MKIAIIPARGGSKRIPRKNIRSFLGRPMIDYAIDAAQACQLFDAILVTTDDPEIADHARSKGASVPFMRPPELSDDRTPTVPVIAHAVRAWDAQGLKADAICCIYPCVPLLAPNDLSRAEDLLTASKADYVFPVVAYPAAVQRALRRAPDGQTRPFDDRYVNTRSQDLEPAFYDAGQFYWGTRAAWLAERNIHLHGRTVEVSSWRAVDIDTLDDWRRAELMYRALSRDEAIA